jgi:hypothetical protein
MEDVGHPINRNIRVIYEIYKRFNANNVTHPVASWEEIENDNTL